jgi:PAS domain S-box-containing protein
MPLRARWRFADDPPALGRARDGCVNEAGEPGDDRVAIAEERDRYALMLGQLPGFVYQTKVVPGARYRYTYLSSDVFLTGHSTDDWYDDPDAWLSVVHPDELDAVRAADEMAVATGKYQLVYRARRLDGDWMWVLDTAQVRVDGDGTRTWTGFCQDVTERFRLERAREVHVRRLVLLLERIRAVVYEIDDRGLVYVSPGVIGGHSSQEFLADPTLWKQVVHPDDVRRVGAQLAAALRQRAAVASEFRMKRPDGTLATATNHLVPYLEADGSTTFIGFVLDVSERKRAEESAQIALHQLTLAIEHADVLPYEFARGQAHVRSGDKLARLIVHPRDRAAFETAHRNAQASSTPVSLEFRFRLDGGAWHWGLARANSVLGAGLSEPRLVSGVLIDTTRERTLSERWREIERTLTPRERQTFLLLGRGATNNDIAAAMGISHSTATHHVARVLTKLALPNRAAGAALASELRLSIPRVADVDMEK